MKMWIRRHCFPAKTTAPISACMTKGTSPIPFCQTPLSRVEKFDHVDAQSCCDPVDRFERGVRLSSLQIADEFLMCLRLCRQRSLGHVQGKPQLPDLPAQLILDVVAGAFCHQGLRYGEGPPRILWGLRWSRRVGMTPLTLSRFRCSRYGDVVRDQGFKLAMFTLKW